MNKKNIYTKISYEDGRLKETEERKASWKDIYVLSYNQQFKDGIKTTFVEPRQSL